MEEDDEEFLKDIGLGLDGEHLVEGDDLGEDEVYVPE